MNPRTKKIWIGVILTILVCSLVGMFWVHTQKADTEIADIYLQGKVIKSIDLSKVTEPYTFTIDTPGGGWNKILVEPGKISIPEANCPDQICVHHGGITNGIEPIVCLPHQLVIRIRGKEGDIRHKHDHDHEHDHDAHDDIDGVVK